MKTIEELRDLYVHQIAPGLEDLEKERKKIVRKLLTYAFIIIPVSALLGLLLIKSSPRFATFLIVVGIVIMTFIYQWLIKDYRRLFKTAVIEKLVKFIDDKLAYSKFNKISESLFMVSGLFRQKCDTYSGDDYVSGMLGKTKVEFSELYTAYETRNSRGGSQEHIIFKGLFFAADFNKHFKGRTIVLPDTAEKLLGHVGTFFQSMNKLRGDWIKLEDPEFEKLFVVYGNDQIEARYILSTSLLKRIVDFQKKTGKKIYLSFVGSKVFVAIPYRKDLFEPRVFQTILDFKPVQGYFEDLQLAAGIVDDLNLNTRIWTKE
ncbi:MAG: DUF3137 domain-containing protein [Candidatus Omnitrophota bacterium]